MKVGIPAATATVILISSNLVHAQTNLVISTFENGDITWTNVDPNLFYTVEWQPGLGGTEPWTGEYTSLQDVKSTNDTVTVSVPMVFRVIADDGSAPGPAPAGMVLIPAGDFVMGRQSGSGESDELPIHTNTLSAFYLDQFEVTKGLWDDVKIYADANGYGFANAGSGQGAFHPVHTVNWYDVVKWCNARSEKEGLTPVYYTDATQTTIYKTGNIDLAANFVSWSANGFRLPTEAEWEKAARGTLVGNTYPWGNTFGGGDANYHGSGDPFEPGPSPDTTPVGFYDGDQVPAGPNRANGYGLYDMSGNVDEWCWDWYDVGYYAVSPANDPSGPALSPFGARMLRGGSWDFIATILRCASRIDLLSTPSTTSTSFGFRSARGL